MRVGTKTWNQRSSSHLSSRKLCFRLQEPEIYRKRVFPIQRYNRLFEFRETPKLALLDQRRTCLQSKKYY